MAHPRISPVDHPCTLFLGYHGYMPNQSPVAGITDQAQQTPHVDPILLYCWSNVANGGPMIFLVI